MKTLSAKDVTVNESQRVFVIRCSGGYSCLGFDVVQDRSQRYQRWLTEHGIDEVPNVFPAASIASYHAYRLLLDKVLETCRLRNIRCDVQLTPQLIGKEGCRVEVVDRYGDKRRFRVGRSIGSIPVHLELANTRSRCGGAVTGAPFRSVRLILGKN